MCWQPIEIYGRGILCATKRNYNSVFFLFIIWRKNGRKKPAEVYKILNETHILDDYIFVCYDTLHTLGTEYLVEDITEYTKEKGAAV